MRNRETSKVNAAANTSRSGSRECGPSEVILSSYVVGSHADAPVGADVYDLDLYVDDTKISGISLPGEVYSSCEYNPNASTLLSLIGKSIPVTFKCIGQAGDDLIYGGFGNDNILGHRGTTHS